MEIVRGKKLKNKLSIIVISIIVGIVLLVMGIISYAKSNEEITTLSIFTKNGDSTVNLSGAKYTIKKVTQDKDGKEIEEDAKDFKGNLIGNIENINGTDYRVIESDKNGEINLDLTSGKYRVTEVQAPTGYKLNDNNTYEANLEAKGEYSIFYENKEWEKEYEIKLNDSELDYNVPIVILDIKEAISGEYLALIGTMENYIIPAELMEDNNSKELDIGGYIFRINKENKIKEIVKISSEIPEEELLKIGKIKTYINYPSGEFKMHIVQETDKNYVIGFTTKLYIDEESIESIGALIYIDKSGKVITKNLIDYKCTIDTTICIIDDNNNITTIGKAKDVVTIPEKETSRNEEISFGENGKNTTFIIQFNEEGKINWITDLGIVARKANIAEKDGKILVDININENDIDSGETIDDKIGKYKIIVDNNGKIEEVNKVENPLLLNEEEIFRYNSEKTTSDGGKIISIRTTEGTIIEPKWTVKGERIKLESYESYVIKLNSEDKVEWLIQIDTENPNSTMYETGNIEFFEVDNGYIVTGYLYEINSDDTTDGKEIERLDFELPIEVKLDKNGKIMYAKNVEINEKNDLEYFIKDVISLGENKYLYMKRNLEMIEKPINEIPSIKENSQLGKQAVTIELNIFKKLEKYDELEEKREKIDKQIINITNKQEESLQIIKKDSRTAELLPGAKFTIKRINENTGNITKEDAVDKDGKLIGNIENIDGKDLRVVTTNEKGEINESLPIGKYEIVEVKAPEGYYLKPTVEENTYEVEITEKQEEKKEWKESWNRIVGSKHFREPERMGQIYDKNSGTGILKKDETGVIVYLDLDNTIIPAEDTVNNKEININNPIILKYNLDNKVEWVKNTISAKTIDKMDNGKYKLYGYNNKNKEIIINAEDTVNNKPIIVNSESVNLILNEDFKVEAIINCSYSELIKDNIYKINFYRDTIIPELGNMEGKEINLKKGEYIVKINEQLKIEKIIAKLTNNDEVYTANNNTIIYKISPTENRSIQTIENKEIELISGKEYLIKSDYNGNILNIFAGVDEIQELTIDKDGYLVKVFNENNITISQENTISGQEVSLKNYMYLKLDNNLKLINNTIDLWKNEKSFEDYLTLVDVVEDGYLIKAFSTITNTINTDKLNNEKIVIDPRKETILKFDKNLNVLEKLNEFYLSSYYTNGEYSTSWISKKENGIYNIRRRVPYGGITIPAEDTASNEEIYISSGLQYILYDSEFKVLGIDMNIPNYITENGYIWREDNDEETIIPGNKTVSGEDIKLKEGYSYILYNKNMKVERVLTGYNFKSEYTYNIENTLYIQNNGDEFTIKAEDTENNEEIIVEANSSFLVFLNLDTLKIKKIMYIPYYYNSYYIEIIEDGYIAQGGGYGVETIIPGKYTESGKDISILDPYNDYTFKYNKEGKIQCVVKGYMVSEEKIENGYKIITHYYDEEEEESRTILTILDQDYNIIKEIKDFVLETSDNGYILFKEYRTNTTITKENNTTGEDIFVNKGTYFVKENKDGKIEWLVENTVNTRELVEINNQYFGRFEEDKGNYNYEFGFFKISEKTIKEQLTNKKVINITNESDVGKIVTKYVDKATNKEIAVSEEITDRVGVDYETKAKEIEYYKLEGTPENAKGKVTNGTTEVIYYYNKQDFNIKADKTISELYVNGEKQDVKNNKNNIFQVSINRKEVTKTDLKIRYIIRISNTGEIPGTAGKVTDQIPEGLEFHQEDNPDYWKLENGVAITDKLDNKVILPGQFEELEIILRCSNLEDKLGVKTNHIVAENMKNEPNFDDTNKEDDKGKCDLIVSIGLGGTDIIAILGISTISLIVVAKVINKFRKRSK